MVTLLFTSSSPLVSVIVAGVETEKSIVSPSFAFASAWRNEPAPLSFVLVTVMVAACAVCTLAIAAKTSVVRSVFFFMGLWRLGMLFELEGSAAYNLTLDQDIDAIRANPECS